MAKTISDHASKGGKARAKALTKAERSEIARRAVEARWEKEGKLRKVQRATHTGELQIGEVSIACAVLEDGTRLITQYDYFKAIGRSGKPAKGRGSAVEKMAPFLNLNNLKPFVDKDLEDSTKPIVFSQPGGSRAFGYRAETLPRVCEVYLRARDAGALLKAQYKFAKACDLIIRGLAHVGIIALVDEATGYQADRARNALAKILEQFLSDELRRWVKTFPDDYFRELCRLKGVQFRSDMKLPQYFGHYTKNIVYRRLAPGVLRELQDKNPRVGGGRKHKHHQWLSADIGHPKLLEHLGLVIGVMKLSDSYADFKKKLDKISPIYPESGSAPLFESVESS